MFSFFLISLARGLSILSIFSKSHMLAVLIYLIFLCGLSLLLSLFPYYFLNKNTYSRFRGFSGGSVVKNLPANVGDVGSIPGWRKSPGGGNGKPFQCSFDWEISWTEEPGGLQSMGLRKSQTQFSNYTTTALDLLSFPSFLMEKLR